jgi:hypothetical protein
VNPIQKSQPLIYSGFTGAFASFFQTGDPNANKFIIKSDRFENVKVEMLDKRCGFWREVAADVPI